jgi:N-terminal acetyltransferase B complex non-catalytic subunit
VAQDAIESYQCAIDDDGRITKTLLTTDRHPADDFCVIAAMCLIKLSLMHAEDGLETLRNIRISYILQATSLLEYAWTHSKSNFQISLLLIRLHCYLGCGSLAMRAYQRLSLKQTQFDTLSYTLFDRISSFHPHPFGHSPDGSTQFKTAVEHLQKQQKLYRTARDHVTKNVWTSFKHGSYNSIFEIREVSETLSHTLSGAMSVIESSKVSRLTEKTPLTAISGGYDILRKSIFSCWNSCQLTNYQRVI